MSATKSWTYYIPEGTQIWRTMRDELVHDHQGHLMLAENRWEPFETTKMVAYTENYRWQSSIEWERFTDYYTFRLPLAAAPWRWITLRKSHVLTDP